VSISKLPKRVSIFVQCQLKLIQDFSFQSLKGTREHCLEYCPNKAAFQRLHRMAISKRGTRKVDTLAQKEQNWERAMAKSTVAADDETISHLRALQSSLDSNPDYMVELLEQSEQVRFQDPDTTYADFLFRMS
jgi:hypothetical protein